MTRIEKIRNKLTDLGDAILITSESNRFYAASFESSAGFVLISQTEASLYLDFRYYEMAKIAQGRGEILSDFNIVLLEKRRKEYLLEFIERNNIRALLFEDRSTTYQEYIALSSDVSEMCTLSGAGDLLENCRMYKDEAELSAIREAQKITDSAFSHILNFITPNVTEIDIALELEFFMRKNGASGIAFETICVGGTKSSLPHGKPENIKLGTGFLTMDFGAKFKNYCSDMTRTICIGNPTDEMRKVYQTVLEAQNKAFNEIYAGVIGKRVDAAARDYIYNKGYRGCFGHSTGHSLGIDIHEFPNFSPNCDYVIEKNAVLSVEPGIYIEGKFGVRIEDIVKISEFGFENFTKSSKELIII